jgi:hypothetical protein
LIKLRIQTSEESERLDNKRKEEPGKTKNEVLGYGQTGRLNGWNELRSLTQKVRSYIDIYFAPHMEKCIKITVFCHVNIYCSAEKIGICWLFRNISKYQQDYTTSHSKRK